MTEKRACALTIEQCEAIGERIECHLDDTSDWQLPDDKYNEIIQFWIDVLNELEVEHTYEEYLI